MNTGTLLLLLCFVTYAHGVRRVAGLEAGGGVIDVTVDVEIELTRPFHFLMIRAVQHHLRSAWTSTNEVLLRSIHFRPVSDRDRVQHLGCVKVSVGRHEIEQTDRGRHTS